MKPVVLLLALSVAANAAFVTFAIRAKPGASSFPDFFSKASQGTETRATAVGASGEISADTNAADTKTWSAFQTGDFKTLVDRLRAAGFPASVIRAIVAAQLNERYSAQRKALLAGQPERPFWERNGMFSGVYDVKLMASLRDLGRQQTKEMKDLLGPDDGSGGDERRAWQRRQYGDLPTEKLEEMQSIISDYSELRNDIYSKINGVMLPEDREKIALLQKEERTDLASVLTPEELENYELRSGSTANQIRSQLSIFKPTEQEFRALFKATRAAEDQYGALVSGGIRSSEQAEKIRTAVLAELQPQLNPARYAELSQATDPKYSMANRLVARLELPASAAVEIVAIQQDTIKRMTEVRRNTEMPPAQRQEQLNALVQEASAKLTTTLTPRGFEAYKQYGGGWLQTVQPPRTGQPAAR